MKYKQLILALVCLVVVSGTAVAQPTFTIDDNNNSIRIGESTGYSVESGSDVKSLDPDVATVENGQIVGQSVGTATIRATKDGQATQREIEVTEPPVDRITFNAPDTMVEDTWSNLDVIVHYSTGTTKDVTEDVTFSVDNPEVITINTMREDELYAQSVGSANITATYEGEVFVEKVETFGPQEGDVSKKFDERHYNQSVTFFGDTWYTNTSATETFDSLPNSYVSENLTIDNGVLRVTESPEPVTNVTTSTTFYNDGTFSLANDATFSEVVFIGNTTIQEENSNTNFTYYDSAVAGVSDDQNFQNPDSKNSVRVEPIGTGSSETINGKLMGNDTEFFNIWRTATDWDNSVDETNGIVHDNIANSNYTNASNIYHGYDLNNPYLGSDLAVQLPLHTNNKVEFQNGFATGGGTSGIVDGILETGATDFRGDNTVNDIVFLENEPADLGIDTNGTHTVSAWIKPSANPDEAGVITSASHDAKGSGAGSSKWRFGQDYQASNPDALVVDLRDEDGDTLRARTQDGALNMGSWQHVAYSYDGGQGAGSIQFYVNGSEVTTNNAYAQGYSGYAPNQGEYTNIGKDVDGNKEYDGLISNVRVYNREMVQSDMGTVVEPVFGTETLTTGTKTFSSQIDPSTLELRDLNLNTPSGGNHQVKVQVLSDPDNNGVYEEESDNVTVTSGNTYSVTGLTSNSDRFRLRIYLQNADISAANVFKSVSLYGPTQTSGYWEKSFNFVDSVDEYTINWSTGSGDTSPEVFTDDSAGSLKQRTNGETVSYGNFSDDVTFRIEYDASSESIDEFNVTANKTVKTKNPQLQISNSSGNVTSVSWDSIGSNDILNDGETASVTLPVNLESGSYTGEANITDYVDTLSNPTQTYNRTQFDWRYNGTYEGSIITPDNGTYIERYGTEAPSISITGFSEIANPSADTYMKNGDVYVHYNLTDKSQGVDEYTIYWNQTRYLHDPNITVDGTTTEYSGQLQDGQEATIDIPNLPSGSYTFSPDQIHPHPVNWSYYGNYQADQTQVAQATNTTEVNVTNATITGFNITGPDVVEKNGTEVYGATITFDNGKEQKVTAILSSGNESRAKVVGGMKVEFTNESGNVTITAEYFHESTGEVFTDSKVVTIGKPGLGEVNNAEDLIRATFASFQFWWLLIGLLIGIITSRVYESVGDEDEAYIAGVAMTNVFLIIGTLLQIVGWWIPLVGVIVGLSITAYIEKATGAADPTV